jgi:hypothetical protein
MIEKVLLHLLYESEVRNISLPLDFVAHRLYPGATGEALRQRAERLRKELIAEGHLVPPKAGKKKTNLDAKVRGHIRKVPGDSKNILETREVLFTEPLNDAEFNDPTGYQLVHNKSSQNKTPKATAAVVKRDESDANCNSASESSDEAEDSAESIIEEDDSKYFGQCTDHVKDVYTAQRFKSAFSTRDCHFSDEITAVSGADVTTGYFADEEDNTLVSLFPMLRNQCRY